MTKEEYRIAIEDVIYLTTCAVNGIVPDQKRTAGMNLSHVYIAAQRHLLTAAIGMALQAAGFHDAEIAQEMAKVQRKNALLDADRLALFARLEQAGIWYMPLKGSVLKEFYPKYGMRQMADNDILINADKAEEVKTIMESLGFTTEHFGKSNHDVYYKEPVSNFEIHTALFGPTHEEKIYQYYRNVKSRLVKDEGNLCGFHFTPEDFYLYMTAHEYKHFSGGGTGLRSFLDVYIFLKKYHSVLDMTYIESEAKKLGIEAFEKQSRNLAMHLYGGEPLTETDKETLEYVAMSGVYGTVTHSMENKVKKLGGGMKGKIKYFLRRLVLPMDSIKTAYPFIYKHKILIPFFTIYRLGKGLIFRRKRVQMELRTLSRMK